MNSPTAAASPIARFAWLPRKPGAEILNSVIPFIGIALAGFSLLAGLVLRYMRSTAATIAAGENRLRYLALHDPLCGLPNRNFFSERLEAGHRRYQARRRRRRRCSISTSTISRTSTIRSAIRSATSSSATSRCGCRISCAATIWWRGSAATNSRSSPPLRRDHTALHEIASRMIETLCAPYSVSGHTIVIGASIGIAVIDQRAGGSADIMRYADMALYRAKNEGRNRACIYDAVMDADLSQRKLVEQDLRETIENDGLKVFYQPIFNAGGDKVVGVEALARWPHPTRGSIPPGEFIPIAEHSGLIIELGAKVLRRACLDGMAWPGITVSVNVSPLQFRRLDFVSMVERILAETGFDPDTARA